MGSLSVYLPMHEILSVRGTSMSENHDTKVCQHTKNHVAKIGLSGRKWASPSSAYGGGEGAKASTNPMLG